MNGFFASGYDVLMIIWGLVFIVGAVGFLVGMNRLFQTEERLQAESLSLPARHDRGDSQPFHPTA